jgi:hypothetical protein
MVSLKYTEALMMEAVRTSETSVYFNDITRRYVAESCHLHTRRRENMKFHKDRDVHVVHINGVRLCL